MGLQQILLLYIKDFRKLLDEILEIVDGPVSAEVIATDYEGILKEARELSKIHKNIVVKVPLIKEGMKAVKTLSEEGIRTNVTLCFSPSQALLAAKAGASYIRINLADRADLQKL